MSVELLELNSVSLVFPVLAVKQQSIRHTMLNAVTGGRVLKNSSNDIHVQALENINLKLFEGDRLGIIGHNGSGKTTLLKVIAGIYEPTTGYVAARGEISSMIDIGSGMDMEASGVENIKLVGRIRGFSEERIRQQIEEIVTFADLGPFIDIPVKTYSAGMVMRLLFAIGTCFTPEILILDEWLGAGDAGFVEKAEARMEQFVADSKLLIIASHNLEMIQRRCNKVCAMESGQIKFFGDSQQYFS